MGSLYSLRNQMQAFSVENLKEFRYKKALGGEGLGIR
jgi:hypothetical protein